MEQSSPIVPLALRAQEAATLLGIGLSTFYQLIREGAAPPADIEFGVGGRRWSRAALETWLAQQAAGNDAEKRRARRTEVARKAARARWAKHQATQTA